MKKSLLTLLAAHLLTGTALSATEPDSRFLVLKDRKGAALHGYDAVAYFTVHQPLKGNPKFQFEYQGARYYFTSADHQQRFAANPAQYAPAYGGYCGYAASIGKVRPANPRLWSIVEGQLIVQHTKGAVGLWEKDAAGNKAKADKYWPRLIKAKAGQKNPVDSLLGQSVLGDLSSKTLSEKSVRIVLDPERPWLKL